MLYKRIGRNIRAFRLQRDLTQEQLAERSGICPSFIGHIERGTRKLSVDSLCKIAGVLGCSVDALLEVAVEENEKKQQSAREILRHMMQILDEND